MNRDGMAKADLLQRTAIHRREGAEGAEEKQSYHRVHREKQEVSDGVHGGVRPPRRKRRGYETKSGFWQKGRADT